MQALSDIPEDTLVFIPSNKESTSFIPLASIDEAFYDPEDTEYWGLPKDCSTQIDALIPCAVLWPN